MAERMVEPRGRDEGQLHLSCRGGGQAACFIPRMRLAAPPALRADIGGVSLPHPHLYSREAARLPLFPITSPSSRLPPLADDQERPIPARLPLFPNRPSFLRANQARPYAPRLSEALWWCWALIKNSS
jgi:hypothetical protein